jgi:hypothetical protein
MTLHCCIVACASQGVYITQSLDVMLLEQQFLSASGTNQRHKETFKYAYRQNHPLLQFLPLKLAEWVATTFPEEMGLADFVDKFCSQDLSHILTLCLVSD